MTVGVPRTTGSIWWRRPVPRPGAGLRLLCFPPAGAGASTFRAWGGLLPQVEVLAVQYPGRQDRFAEPCPERMPALADAIAAAVAADLPGPVAFFGHSMGAVVAYEVARRLAAVGVPEPRHLVVSAHPAPTRERSSRPAADTDEAVLDYLRMLGGANAALLDDPDLRELTMPMVRADLRLIGAYRYAPGPPLACPVTAVVGAADSTCGAVDVVDWAARTTGPFDLAVLPGGHFYLESPGPLMALLADRTGVTDTG
jgi:surfactin synthase thioesterase subunit